VTFVNISKVIKERNMRLAALLCGGLLAALPASGQTILAVLGGNAVGTDDAGAVVTIDPNTGVATVLGTPIAGESLTGVARLNDGRIVASTATFEGNSRLIEVDPATGALIQTIGDFTDGKLLLTMHDLTVDPDTGTLYGISIGETDRPSGRREGGRGGAVTGGGGPVDENAIFTIDPATAQCTFIGTPITPTTFTPLAAAGGQLWGLPASEPNIYRLNSSNAAQLGSTAVTGTNGDGGMGLGLLAAGVNPQFIFAACCENGIGNEIFRIDGNSGVATLLGSAGGNRRVHDLVVIPGVGPGPGVLVEVPVLGSKGILVLAMLLAVAGSALLFWRR
jgi:hypothetical protein